MRGNHTIAFVLKDYNEIILSSNCGSLFYYYDKDKNLISYASEKIYYMNILLSQNLLKV